MINETIHKHWRDWLAVVYIIICLWDFIIGAAWWNLSIQSMFLDCLASGRADQATCFTNVPGPWAPYTLQNGGMFHVAMGAILGAAAWKRHEEQHERNVSEGNS